MLKRGLWKSAALAAFLGGQVADAQTPIPPSPKDFLRAAAQSDQYEIMAATTAATQTEDPSVRAFAEKMIEDHTRLEKDLRQAAMESGLPAPEMAMSSDQASLLGGLQSAQGKDFDRIYARQQELAHDQALAVTESFAAAGSDPNLRKAANAALPVIREHLKLARQLSAAVGGA